MTLACSCCSEDKKKLIIDGNTLSIEDLVWAGKCPNVQVEIKEENWERIGECRKLVDKFYESGTVIYGVNTSCGGLVNYLLPKESDYDFQRNLCRCVATQVGPEFPDYLVRTAMIARANSLCRGYSGIKPENLKIYMDMINKGVVPVVLQKGSLGTSGDLGPLASIALVCFGEWKAHFQGKEYTGKEAMDKAGIPTMHLNCKEGLSLINGTSFMVAVACDTLVRSRTTMLTSDCISGLVLQVLLARKNPFDLRVHQQKYHPGQFATAMNLNTLLEGSGMALDEHEVSSSLSDVLKKLEGVAVNAEIPVEDAYSLRCTPQIVGPSKDAVVYAETTLLRELNSSNDNPLIFTDYETFIHNGNFHGQCISLPMDMVCNALTMIGVLADRRIDRMLDKSNSVGLPPFLCKENTGIRMGLMGGQFMTASICAENRILCHPASIQSIPTTADFQDVVSFGLIACRQALEINKNVNYCLAFELMCAAQAVDLRGGTDKLSAAGKAVYDLVRTKVPYFDKDEVIMDYLETLSNMIEAGHVVDVVEKAIQKKLVFQPVP